MEPIKTPENGDNRDEKGRFQEGNTASRGRGRPPKERERRWLQVLRDEVSPEAWASVVRVALQAAQKGDRHARQFLAQYLIDFDVYERIEQLEEVVRDMQAQERAHARF